MNDNTTIIESREAKVDEKKRRRGFFIYMIFAVICSVVLWFYVAGVDTDMAEKKFTGLSIDLRNQAQMTERTGFTILSGGTGVSVDLTVTGRRSDISRLKNSDVSVWVDLNVVQEAGANKLVLNADLPDGMTVSACYPQSITVYTDEAITKTVPVEVRELNMYKAHDLELSKPKLTRTEVTVTGPAHLLETVTVAALSLDLGTVTKSFDVSSIPVLRDKDGKTVESPYLKWDNAPITASYSLYKTKDLQLGVGFKHGYMTMEDVALTLSSPTLRVKGEPEVIDGMAEVLLIQTVDETTLLASGNDYKISADMIKLPAGVAIDDGAILSGGVELFVKPINAHKSLSIPLNQLQGNVVKVVGLQEQFTYKFLKDFLTLELRGSEGGLLQLLPENVELEVNLADYNAIGAKRDVQVTVRFNNSKEAYVVGTYTVDVEVLEIPPIVEPIFEIVENIS